MEPLTGEKADVSIPSKIKDHAVLAGLLLPLLQLNQAIASEEDNSINSLKSNLLTVIPMVMTVDAMEVSLSMHGTTSKLTVKCS
jgi:hypothetical protein